MTADDRHVLRMFVKPGDSLGLTSILSATRYTTGRAVKALRHLEALNLIEGNGRLWRRLQ